MPLVGWWPLTSENGDATDYSGNGNHGTLNGGITRGVAGKAGLKAYSFDGSDDWINTGNLPSLSAYTISAWVKSTSIGDGTQGRIYNSTQNNQFMLFEDNPNTGEWSLTQNDGSGWVQITAAGTKNKWTHLTGTWDGTEIKLYKNGQKTDSASTTSLSSTSNTDAIGKRTGGFNDQFYGGKICDVRVYDHALTRAEIQQLYRQGSADVASPPGTHKGKAYTTSDTVAYYPLNGDVKDYWGSSDGTDNTSAGYSSSGVRGKAKSFDGSDDYVSFTPSVSNNFTIALWIRTSNTSSRQQIIGLEGSSDNFWLGTNVTGNNGDFHIRGLGDNNINASTTVVATGSWMFLTAVVDADAGEARSYVNGRLDDTISASSATLDSNAWLGNRVNNPNGRWYSGDIDDVRIYNRALKPHEIQQIYQYGTRGVDMRRHLANKRK